MGEPISDAGRAMYTDDFASQTLGIDVVLAESGHAVTTMTVRAETLATRA